MKSDCYTGFMKKVNQLEERIQKGGYKHEQHTGTFYKEMNKPKEVQEPFRILDEVWIVGKHKGGKVKDAPKHYLQWVIQNFNHLSKTHKSILENYLQNDSKV
jgi:hypothetical protein